MQTTKNRRTTLPRIPGEVDTEERATLMQQHGGTSCSVTGRYGRFSLPSQSWDCQITPNRIHQCLNYPEFKMIMSDRKTWQTK